MLRELGESFYFCTPLQKRNKLARTKNKLTQKELAKKMGTEQSVISRVENAKTTPTFSFLKKLASVLDTKLTIEFGKHSSI